MGCDFATNGAFFDMSGEIGCESVVVSDEKVYGAFKEAAPVLGVRSVDNTVVVSYVGKDLLGDGAWEQLIQGRGWLVRNGTVTIEDSPDLDVTSKFVMEKAPRTAVGIMGNGTIALISVDGEESIDEGADLFEFAELIQATGFVVAINLDGGGSQTVVLDGEVYNVPHCNDTDSVCQRKVGAISCLNRESN
mmetsp:Transcript_2019/g.4065  ORF Transcript_2019/g.4065 Transcript_2019/m.4065 type:complete len:191 (+) Transcript_2019:338-910(+)